MWPPAIVSGELGAFRDRAIGELGALPRLVRGIPRVLAHCDRYSAPRPDDGELGAVCVSRDAGNLARIETRSVRFGRFSMGLVAKTAVRMLDWANFLDALSAGELSADSARGRGTRCGSCWQGPGMAPLPGNSARFVLARARNGAVTGEVDAVHRQPGNLARMPSLSGNLARLADGAYRGTRRALCK